jgi:hypothetical protein
LIRPFISWNSVSRSSAVGVFEVCLGVGVLGFKIFADVCAQDGRVAHHFLPGVVFHPVIRIDTCAADLGDLEIHALCHWGCRRGIRRFGGRRSGKVSFLVHCTS